MVVVIQCQGIKIWWFWLFWSFFIVVMFEIGIVVQCYKFNKILQNITEYNKI